MEVSIKLMHFKITMMRQSKSFLELMITMTDSIAS